MKLRITALAALSALTLALSAKEMPADSLFAKGYYAESADRLASTADSRHSDIKANTMAAEALMRSGRFNDAEKYIARSGANAGYLTSLRKFLHYDFDGAEEALAKYTSLKDHNSTLAEALEKSIETGRNMLDRVEKIVVIDSMQVNRSDFFRHYMLGRYAGSLADASSLPDRFSTAPRTAVFSTEHGDHLMWGDTDRSGKTRIVESSQLADGTWEKPRPLDSAVNAPSATRVNYPFTMADGVTLYFASNNPETSLGGYDIYITRFDGEKYLEPQNIGMPYNSPFDDYLLAIDENSGAGWWATERNAAPGKVTIYMFRPSDLRVNFPPETENLKSFARLDNYKATQPKGFDAAAVINEVKASQAPSQTHAVTDFEFSLPDGRVITSMDQLSSQAAVNAFDSYIERLNELDDVNFRLEELREAYGKGDKSGAEEILSLEGKQEKLRKEIKRLFNLAVEIEIKNKK